MTRTKEEFVPMEEGKVKMYACGPTVYNYFHLGNARPFVTFDTLRRYLEYRGYDVTFIWEMPVLSLHLIRCAVIWSTEDMMLLSARILRILTIR